MSMFKDAIDSYTREDVPLAMSIIPRDEELDEANATLQKQFIDRMGQDPEQLRGYLNLIFIARCMERVGDHATNIAEDAVYAAAAEDIRHPSQTANAE
jgi:phosphate transport system protein